jgi:hypothetical protein
MVVKHDSTPHNRQMLETGKLTILRILVSYYRELGRKRDSIVR